MFGEIQKKDKTMNTSSPAVTSTGTLCADSILHTVLMSEKLPTLPTVASKLVALAADEKTTLSDVADLVSQDIALSSRILKVANSAFYSFPQQIGSISQAISMLGTNAVQSLVLSFSFVSMNKVGRDSSFDFDQFLQRSLGSASAAKLILGKIPEADTEEVFAAGLLQNLGELLLACTLPEEYEKVFVEMEAGSNPNSGDSRAAEVSVFGSDHCYFGYEVAKRWNLPLSIALPIRYHHNPSEYEGNDEKTSLHIRAIYLSNVLLNIFYSERPEEYHSQFQTEAKELLGLKSGDIEEILNQAHTELDHAAANFGLEIEETRSIQEILQEANIRLSILNLDYEQVNRELVKAKVSLEKLSKELQEKNEKLKSLADLDGLTGIYNNRYFQGMLTKELSRSARKSYHLSLLLVDIDHFKKFNDDHGHLVGDFILEEFSSLLAAHLREYDTLARYGGEEFVVILPETSEEEAAHVAEKLRAAVEKQRFCENRVEYSVTASYGVATFDGSNETALTNKELVKMADTALYDAKKSGRNLVAVYGAKKKWYQLN